MSEGAAALSGVQPAEPAPDAGTPASAESGSWTDGFNEDTLAYVKNKGWENPGSMLESYRNLEKFSGGSKSLVEIPGVDADEETYGKFYDALGRPESSDKYGAQMPDGGDEQMSDWFRQTAYRYGLSDKQMQGVFNDWNEMSTSRVENMQHDQKVQSENEIAELKQEWGRDYDKNVDAGKIAVNALGYDQEALSSLESKMGTAEMLKLFANIGSKMGEDSFVDGNTSDAGFGTTPAAARNEIAELKADSQFMDRYLSGDRAAVDKMQRLMGKAYG